ncbi:MAG: asparagine synthase [Hyphomicrobiaceae bacterium]|nr:MAG: asparagine synthase [Hyphomicrobiaceae bacterium]
MPTTTSRAVERRRAAPSIRPRAPLMIRPMASTATVSAEAMPVRPRASIAASLFQPGKAGPATLQADFDCCQLDGSALRSAADFERALAAGRLADITGAFAFAGLDGEGELRLARDAVGERTLFYAEMPRGVAYAGSIRDLIASGLVEPRLNLRAVAKYITYAYLPGRETLIQGVHEVLPGEVVRANVAGLDRRNYWQLPGTSVSDAPEAELKDRLRRLLEAATRRLLPPSGVRVGAFLSGGLDSSLAVALAASLHDAPLHTFSVSFGEGHANELPFSSLVARHCSTVHRIVELSPATIMANLDATIALLNDPIGDPLTVPNALLFREAAGEVGVVLNGEGGDPCFGGPKNLPMVLCEIYGGSPGADTREASYLRAHLKCYDDLSEMLSPRMLDALAAAPLEDELAPMLRDRSIADYVARLQAMNIRLKGAHHILPKVDALSRPAGILPRAPLFDRDVVEFSMQVPARLKLKGTVEKHILKEAVRDLLPPEIIARPKSGMLVPVEAWCRGPLLPAARERLLDGLNRYDLFRRAWLERLLAGKLGGLRPRHGAKIWLLMTLQSWLSATLERGRLAA